MKGSRYLILRDSMASITAFVREDTLSRQVFMRSTPLNIYPNDTNEHIIFDPARTVGDSFQTAAGMSYITARDSIFINSVPHVVFTVNPFPGAGLSND